MADLPIRNAAGALKANLDRLADCQGQSLSDTAKQALGEGVNLAKRRLTSNAGNPPLGQRLQAAFAGVFETQDELEEFHSRLDEQRKKDFGRALPDFT